MFSSSVGTWPIESRKALAAWPVHVPSWRAASRPVAVIDASWAAVWKAEASVLTSAGTAASRSSARGSESGSSTAPVSGATGMAGSDPRYRVSDTPPPLPGALSQQAGAGFVSVADGDGDPLGGVPVGGDGDQQRLPGPQPVAPQSSQQRGDPARTCRAGAHPGAVSPRAADG